MLEINPEHPLVQRLNREQDDPRLAEWAHVLFSQAVLTLGARIEDPAAFVGQLNDLLVALVSGDSVSGEAVSGEAVSGEAHTGPETPPA